MSRRGRRRFGGAVACALLTVGLQSPAPASDEPLPGSCTLHPAHVVNPGCVPALTDSVLDPPSTYPDLVPDVREVAIDRPRIGTDPETFEPIFGPPRLQFDTWSQNLGSVALDLVADDPANPTASTVSQCTSWDPDHVCRERRRVGGFVWHDPHTHFHFEDFARYELRRLLADGTPDYSADGLLALSDKVSTCLIDTTPVRDDAFPAATYTLFCNPMRQGISAGWADVYGGGLPGQQFPVEDLADGRYAVVVEVNSADRLWETDHTNNVVEVVVELSGGMTEATIVGRRWP